jgi:hypothetical protein
MVIEELHDKLIAIRNKIWKINLECATIFLGRKMKRNIDLREKRCFWSFFPPFYGFMCLEVWRRITCVCDFGVESKKGVRLTNACKCFFLCAMVILE